MGQGDGREVRGRWGVKLVLFDWIPGTVRVKGLKLWRLVRRPRPQPVFVYVKSSIEMCLIRDCLLPIVIATRF